MPLIVIWREKSSLEAFCSITFSFSGRREGEGGEFHYIQRHRCNFRLGFPSSFNKIIFQKKLKFINLINL